MEGLDDDPLVGHEVHRFDEVMVVVGERSHESDLLDEPQMRRDCCRTGCKAHQVDASTPADEFDGALDRRWHTRTLEDEIGALCPETFACLIGSQRLVCSDGERLCTTELVWLDGDDATRAGGLCNLQRQETDRPASLNNHQVSRIRERSHDGVVRDSRWLDDGGLVRGETRLRLDEP